MRQVQTLSYGRSHAGIRRILLVMVDGDSLGLENSSVMTNTCKLYTVHLVISTQFRLSLPENLFYFQDGGFKDCCMPGRKASVGR